MIVPPFKAEVVGSLLRPAAILDTRAARAQGRASDDDVWAVEARAIEDAVAMQRDVGLKVCTDGEMHRRHWFMDFIERIDGVGFEGSLPSRFHNEAGDIEFAPPRVVGAAIDLDNHLRLVGAEVGGEPPDRHLAAEGRAKRRGAETRP